MKRTGLIGPGAVFATAVLLLLVSCEPVSVSVNQTGDIAFTRSEGVFAYNPTTAKLTTIDWTYGGEGFPVIVRWSPSGNAVACTYKAGKDSQSTKVVLIPSKGENKVVYEAEKVITQLEWSPDGNRITAAQAGDNSDIQSADLVLINPADGSSKVLVKQTGDVHRWLDAKTIVIMQVLKADKDNSDLLQAELSTCDIASGKVSKLTAAVVSKTSGLDASAASKIIVFTALDAGSSADFVKDMKSSATWLYVYDLGTKKLAKLTEDWYANFVRFSPDTAKLLLKAVSTKEDSSQTSLVSLDLKTKEAKVLVENLTSSVTVNSSSVQLYPCWLNNTTALYWIILNVYGSNGQSIQLMGVDTAGLKRVNYQPAIDNAVAAVAQTKGGY